MIELIRNLTETYGPTGNETAVRNNIADIIAPYVDNVRTDALGNIIAFKKGSQSSGEHKLMISAPMDEPSVMVTHIESTGYLRLQPLGPIDPYVLLGQRLRFANGTIGIVNKEPIKDIKDLTFDRLYVDVGATTAKEAGKKVPLGSIACFDQTIVLQGDRLIGKAFSGRLGAAVLIEAMRRASGVAGDTYFVFTTQQHVGSRGAGPVAYTIAPTMAVVVHGTPTGDTPETTSPAVALGKGAAIKVKDKSIIAHPGVKEYLSRLARERKVAHQFEVLMQETTDAGPIHMAGAGVPVGGVAVPVRHWHTPGETVDLTDVNAAVTLLAALIESGQQATG